MSTILRVLQRLFRLRPGLSAVQHDHNRPWKSLYFHHIGKTGGGSIAEMLTSTIGRRKTYPHWGVSSDLLCDNSTYSFFTGHFPFDIITLLPQPTAVITTVREPIEHVLSIYNHLRRTEGQHLLLAHRTQPLTTFDDFLDDNVLKHITTNPQTYSLGRQINKQDLIAVANRIHSVNWTETGSPDDFWCLYGEMDEDRQDMNLFETAIKRLNQPWLVACSCETINEEVSNLFDQLYLSLPKNYSKSPLTLNVAPSDSSKLTTKSLSDSQTHEITSRTSLDHSLWKHVKSLKKTS